MTTTPDLSKLKAVLPETAVSVDELDVYAIDGAAPSVVMRPRAQGEVATALRAANEAGAAVVPFGGGTQQWLGMQPERFDVALDLTAIDTLIEHEPADLTVTVEAGMRLSTLQRLLGEHGQWLPLDPPLPDDATIGGVLATNASGPTRLSRGTARDLVIGMTVATAAGDIVKSGGRVVKNVAGYDLAKLHIGALGTTGVILQVALKVTPIAPQTATVKVGGDLTTLLGLANTLEETRLPVQGAVLSRDMGDGEWSLGLRFAAGSAAVERSLRETRARAGSAAVEDALDADWRAMQVDYAVRDGVIVRASVMPSDLGEVLEAMTGAGLSVSALPGVGVAHGTGKEVIDIQALRSLRQLCERKGGALVVEKAPAELKQAFDVWGAPRGDFALMQRLKHELDPQRTLNPGRFVGGL